MWKTLSLDFGIIILDIGTCHVSPVEIIKEQP
jgi:hypothetical protein